MWSHMYITYCFVSSYFDVVDLMSAKIVYSQLTDRLHSQLFKSNIIYYRETHVYIPLHIIGHLTKLGVKHNESLRTYKEPHCLKSAVLKFCAEL